LIWLDDIVRSEELDVLEIGAVLIWLNDNMDREGLEVLELGGVLIWEDVNRKELDELRTENSDLA